MRISSVKVAFIILFCLSAVLSYGQKSNPDYTIELKNLRPTISLNSDTSNLIFIVTVVNHTGKRQDFGTVMHYGYKKFHSFDYYLEAIDAEGNRVDIDGEDDMDFAYDPLDENVKNYDKIVQKINSAAYYFTPGKYHIRWVYDPAGNRNNPAGGKQNPSFSNWQSITVTE